MVQLGSWFIFLLGVVCAQARALLGCGPHDLPGSHPPCTCSLHQSLTLYQFVILLLCESKGVVRSRQGPAGVREGLGACQEAVFPLHVHAHAACIRAWRCPGLRRSL